MPYADLSDPQALNLYSYVRDNPLSLVDPDGHCDDPETCGMPAASSGDGTGQFESLNCANGQCQAKDSINVFASDGGCSMTDPMCSLNLAQILNTSNLSRSQPKPRTRVPQGVTGCVASFGNTLLGKATKFFSPLSYIPGWNPDFGQAYGDLATWGTAKMVFGEIAEAGSNAFRVVTYSLASGDTIAVPITSELSLAGKAVGRWALLIPAAAGLIDVGAHSRCYANAGAVPTDVVGP